MSSHDNDVNDHPEGGAFSDTTYVPGATEIADVAFGFDPDAVVTDCEPIGLAPVNPNVPNPPTVFFLMMTAPFFVFVQVHVTVSFGSTLIVAD